MKLILVRHGETAHNRAGRILGLGGQPLTPAGRAQAEAAARALRHDLPFALHASPVARAVETARIISEDLKVPLQPPVEGLAEADPGRLEGLTGAEMRRMHPDFARRWDDDPGTARMPGGESLEEVQRRAWRTVEALLSDYPDGSVAAVTHNFVIYALVCRVLGLPLREFRRLRVAVGSISRLEITAASVAVLSLNETGHLPA